MFLATILNYLNRQTLSILAPTLQHQMHMGNAALGALAMWAVGRITQRTDSFTIPMVSVAAAIAVSAIAGWAASRRLPEPAQEGKG